MINDFNLLSISSVPIIGTEDMTRYGTLGFFSLKYIESQDKTIIGSKFIKENQPIKETDTLRGKGEYIKFTILDMPKNKKVTFLFSYNGEFDNITVGELLDVCLTVYNSLSRSTEDCFIQFDYYLVD